MKSSNNLTRWAIEYAQSRLEIFASTELGDPIYINSLIACAIVDDGTEFMDDLLPVLIIQSANSQIVFLMLKRLVASYIENGQPLQGELEEWLISYLEGRTKQPSSGKTGPNKTLIEQLFIMGLVRNISAKTHLPTWPKDSAQTECSILEIIAHASSLHKNKYGRSPLPLKTNSLEKRYIIARKQFSLPLPEFSKKT
tara:strand:+ start:21 stop:611 length:591 start_codon:yes stop_codon:yes gene_type:complete